MNVRATTQGNMQWKNNSDIDVLRHNINIFSQRKGKSWPAHTRLVSQKRQQAFERGGAPPVLGSQRDHYSYSRYDVALIAWFEMACYRCFNSKFQAPQVYASCLPSVKGLLQIPVISPIYVHTHQKSSWGSSAVSQYQYDYHGTKIQRHYHYMKIKTLSRGVGSRLATVI